MASFIQLNNTFKLSHSHVFLIIYKSDTISKGQFKTVDILPVPHVFYDLLQRPPISKHLISQFVSFFSSYTEASNGHLEETWGKELNIERSDDLWGEALSRIHSCSIIARYQWIRCKVRHRLHYSKTKWHRIYPQASPLCDRCKASKGSLTHLFWLCPLLNNYWRNIFDWYSKVYERAIDPGAELALFGCSESVLRSSYEEQQALMFAMVAAKQIVLTEWKWPPPLASGTINLENNSLFRTNYSSRYLKVWGPFLDRLDRDWLWTLTRNTYCCCNCHCCSLLVPCIA